MAEGWQPDCSQWWRQSAACWLVLRLVHTAVPFQTETGGPGGLPRKTTAKQIHFIRIRLVRELKDGIPSKECRLASLNPKGS